MSPTGSGHAEAPSRHAPPNESGVMRPTRSRLPLGFRPAPAGQILSRVALGELNRVLDGLGEIRVHGSPLHLAAQEVGPQELAEGRGVLGKAARPPELAGEAAERIVLEPRDG